jgi:hypothetical protein
MNADQIKMLRFIIKQEIEAAGIDGMEHGAWGWAEKQLDKDWAEFQESFTKDDLVQWYANGYKQGLRNAANKTIELIQNLVDEYENPSAKAIPPGGEQ